MGNKIRFINHASSEHKTKNAQKKLSLRNVYPRIMLCNMAHRIGMYASKDIDIGEELFFDYGKGYHETLYGAGKIHSMATDEPVVQKAAHKLSLPSKNSYRYDVTEEESDNDGDYTISAMSPAFESEDDEDDRPIKRIRTNRKERVKLPEVKVVRNRAARKTEDRGHLKNRIPHISGTTTATTSVSTASHTSKSGANTPNTSFSSKAAVSLSDTSHSSKAAASSSKIVHSSKAPANSLPSKTSTNSLSSKAAHAHPDVSQSIKAVSVSSKAPQSSNGATGSSKTSHSTKVAPSTSKTSHLLNELYSASLDSRPTKVAIKSTRRPPPPAERPPDAIMEIIDRTAKAVRKQQKLEKEARKAALKEFEVPRTSGEDAESSGSSSWSDDGDGDESSEDSEDEDSDLESGDSDDDDAGPRRSGRSRRQSRKLREK